MRLPRIFARGGAPVSADPNIALYTLMQRADGRSPCCSSGTAASPQTPTEPLHVPELDAGVHVLYELKPAETHKQFEA